MKLIVLIGRANDLMQGLNSSLRRYFRVHMYTGDPQSVLGMMKVGTPDLAIIGLTGLAREDLALFEGLRQGFPRLPVLTIGTEQERAPFAPYYGSGQFENLTRPLESAVVLSAICRRLGTDMRQVMAEAASSGGGRKKVLVVDDNATTLRSIKGMLETKYDVTLANSGMKAMTSIGKSRPDVILLDYEMPVCDGRQTLEMIRADDDLYNIPVIFLTSVNDKEQINAVIKLLPAGYLLKPATPRKLFEAIEKALE